MLGVSFGDGTWFWTGASVGAGVSAVDVVFSLEACGSFACSLFDPVCVADFVVGVFACGPLVAEPGSVAFVDDWFVAWLGMAASEASAVVVVPRA